MHNLHNVLLKQPRDADVVIIKVNGKARRRELEKIGNQNNNSKEMMYLNLLLNIVSCNVQSLLIDLSCSL